MPDLTTKEAFQLMLAGPIQMANSRVGRSHKRKDMESYERWKAVSSKLQEALNLAAEAAAKDTPK